MSDKIFVVSMIAIPWIWLQGNYLSREVIQRVLILLLNHTIYTYGIKNHPGLDFYHILHVMYTVVFC